MEICITSCGDKWDTWKSFVLGGELFFTETFSKSSERIIIDHFTVHLHYP